MVIRGGYPEERVVRVIKQMPHYSPQVQIVQQNRIPQNPQYVEYASHEPVVYGKYANS